MTLGVAVEVPLELLLWCIAEIADDELKAVNFADNIRHYVR